MDGDFTFTISGEESGLCLGEALRRRGFSRRLVTRLKRTENGLTRNGLIIRTVDKVYGGEEIVIRERQKNPPQAGKNLSVKVLYEDSDTIVFDKPSGMAVHQSIKHRDDTLANAFAQYLPGHTFRALNRLDKNTSGLVVCAKNQRAAHSLQGVISKRYIGLIKNPTLSGGRICKPIARQSDSIILRCIREDGQYAATCWRVVKRMGEFALCEFILETGRTHQIRVHMASIGYPLIGDDMYGGDVTFRQGQALHCAEVSFTTPCTNERITVKSAADFFTIKGELK